MLDWFQEAVPDSSITVCGFYTSPSRHEKLNEPFNLTQVDTEGGGNIPRDLANLPVVHCVEDRGVAHPLADPQLDADARV